MSLINDALRRAKQAQQSAPPSDPTPVSQFRPVEPSAEAVKQRSGLLLPIALAMVALLSLLLLWQLSKQGSGTPNSGATAPLNVAARTIPVEQSATPVPVETPNTQPTSATMTTVKPSNAMQPESAVSIAEHGSNTAVVSTSAVSTNLTTTESTDTNHVAAEPPQAPLKLQSIVYSPRRPSALINGRVVFVGDKVRDVKVTAIHSGDVVLTGGGRTNVLSLDP